MARMTSSTGALAGTSALVTGATSGLGRAVALRLAQAGAHVALLGRSEPDLRDAAHEVAAEDVRALPVAVDLAETHALSDVVDRAASELGNLAVLVNAAATDVAAAAEDLPLRTGRGSWR